MSKLTTIAPRLGGLPVRLVAPPKKVELFYQSKEWRGLVSSIKKQRGAWCQRCGSTKGLIADHIIERKDGGAELDPANIELLCGKHHAIKTAEARKRRALGLAST